MCVRTCVRMCCRISWDGDGVNPIIKWGDRLAGDPKDRTAGARPLTACHWLPSCAGLSLLHRAQGIGVRTFLSYLGLPR